MRRLAIPFEWQQAVIRAAITLQQNAFDDTGAIIAAMTTSVPEASVSGRNWDYRYCWLRDSYFVVDALNRLNATDTMERYLGYILNVVAGNGEPALQPVYRINGDAALAETQVASLPGYRGMGPVRIGNDAYRQVQHDVYGSAILAATHVFFDERLDRRGDARAVRATRAAGPTCNRGVRSARRRACGSCAAALPCTPFPASCAGPPATVSPRSPRASASPARASRWRADADRIARFIHEHCWSDRRGSYVATADGDALDASLLLLADLNFVAPSDPRFVATVEAIGRELKRGDFVFRYVEEDDFGAPQNAFVICSFWYVDALAAIGRRDEARALFLRLLGHRNRHGLLAEHLDVVTGEPWGNFVQTYSMVGLIIVRDPAFDTLGRDGVDRFTVRRTIVGADPSTGGSAADPGAPCLRRSGRGSRWIPHVASLLGGLSSSFGAVSAASGDEEEGLMAEGTDTLQARLARLERRHGELLAGRAEMKERYEALLRLTKELAAHAAEVSMRASANASAERATKSVAEAFEAMKSLTPSAWIQ